MSDLTRIRDLVVVCRQVVSKDVARTIWVFQRDAIEVYVTKTEEDRIYTRFLEINTDRVVSSLTIHQNDLAFLFHLY